MTITLTISVDSPAHLRQAIASIGEQLGLHDDDVPPAPIAVASVEPTKPRGRPRKVEPDAPVEPLDIPAPAVAAAKVAERIAAVSAEAPTVNKADVQKVLIAVVQKHGRDECGKLCAKHGGPNLSALDPSVYPALLADAQAVLSTDADPVA